MNKVPLLFFVSFSVSIVFCHFSFINCAGGGLIYRGDG